MYVVVGQHEPYDGVHPEGLRRDYGEERSGTSSWLSGPAYCQNLSLSYLHTYSTFIKPSFEGDPRSRLAPRAVPVELKASLELPCGRALCRACCAAAG